jgi:hypothetical protein
MAANSALVGKLAESPRQMAGCRLSRETIATTILEVLPYTIKNAFRGLKKRSRSLSSPSLVYAPFIEYRLLRLSIPRRCDIMSPPLIRRIE